MNAYYKQIASIIKRDHDYSWINRYLCHNKQAS